MSGLNKDVVDYNIEYAHVYASDIRENLSRLDSNIEKTISILDDLNRKKMSYSLSVFVDDYSEHKETIDHKEIISLCNGLKLPPDHVIMESAMAEVAKFFINKLPERYLLSEDNTMYFKSESTDIHFSNLLKDRRRYKAIFIEKAEMGKKAWEEQKQKEYLALRQQRCHSNSSLILYYDDGKSVHYSCPLLAACWYMARLGVEPYFSSIQKKLTRKRPFIGKRLITVLPIEFLKVESTAIELIGLSKTKVISKNKKKIEYHFITQH